MTALITGGTGTLGRALRHAMQAAGTEPRVLSRGPRPQTESTETWATGDLRTGTGLDEALRGVTTIIHCATDGRSDVESTRTLIAAAQKEGAQKAGASHLIYISIVGVDRHPLPYYRAKLEVEGLIEQSGLPWTILRATQFHSFVAALFRAQRWLPVVFAPTFAFQPVEVAEVAERLAELAEGSSAGRVADMGGPEVVDGKRLAATYLSARRSRRRVVPLHLPGKIFSAFEAGYHLTPEHRVGRKTFAEFLANLPVGSANN